MAKIKNYKYYTSPDLAKYVFGKTLEIIGEKNISEYLEPSAGNGVFLQFFDKDYLAYDIEPEHENIVKQDFLKLEIPYKKGRLIIGNPPFGHAMNLARQFYKKSCKIGEYVCFILPISQYKNNIGLCNFDLIYSEDLGKRKYSDREIHCTFNIYKKPEKEKKYEKLVLDRIDVFQYERHRNRDLSKRNFNYDLRICGFGASLGKEVEYEGQYVSEYVIKIDNSIENKKEIIEFLKQFDWKKEYNLTNFVVKNLSAWQIKKVLLDNFSNLKKKSDKKLF